MWNVNFAALPPCFCWPERLSRRRTETVAGVKNYTSISCHSFLPSPPPSVAEQAQQLAQDAEQGADQIKVVEHGGYPMMGDWTASSGQGGVGYMTGFAACAVPETGPLMRQPRRDPSRRGFLPHKTDYGTQQRLEVEEEGTSCMSGRYLTSHSTFTRCADSLGVMGWEEGGMGDKLEWGTDR
uniref:Uncharacterized protein n=1 Tax=uncultured prokaryote TaxID=198431 RepID=A0A0H5PYJ6_9ZZZZ|nr:hypothetical protein [uncultured prokaryote]